MATLSDRDAAAWYRLAGRIARVAEPRLGQRVLANRVLSPGPEWHLEPVRSALRRARRGAASLSLRSVVVRTDVAGFYPSVTPAPLFRVLRRLGVPVADAATASDMLDGWGGHGYPGLPVGPSGSAVLGNLMLAPVDAAIKGREALRWVDDYLIALPSEDAARRAIERLDEALDELGLRRASRKTHLLDGGRPVRWLGMSAGRP